MMKSVLCEGQCADYAGSAASDVIAMTGHCQRNVIAVSSYAKPKNRAFWCTLCILKITSNNQEYP